MLPIRGGSELHRHADIKRRGITSAIDLGLGHATDHAFAVGPAVPDSVRNLKDFEKLGYGNLPVCIAKTHLSISGDASLKGAPKGHTLTVREVRASVGAAALGFAEAALDMGIARASSRPMFGATLADLQITQAAIGDMSTEIDAATLLVYRAAWERDILKQRTTRSAAMAKLFATESAQRIIDRCVQLHGGLGVKVGHPMEMLYREIRALRIYEGATEVQQVVIARETMKNKTGGV